MTWATFLLLASANSSPPHLTPSTSASSTHDTNSGALLAPEAQKPFSPGGSTHFPGGLFPWPHLPDTYHPSDNARPPGLHTLKCTGSHSFK